MHLFLVATNLEAVLLILPLLIYTLQAYLTILETWMIGLLLWGVLPLTLEWAIIDECCELTGDIKEEFIF